MDPFRRLSRGSQGNHDTLILIIVLICFHGTPKATLHSGTVAQLAAAGGAASRGAVLKLAARPHKVTEAGKELIAKLPQVREEFEAFRGLACEGWSQEIDEQLIKKAEEKSVRVLEKSDSIEDMEAAEFLKALAPHPLTLTLTLSLRPWGSRRKPSRDTAENPKSKPVYTSSRVHRG